MGQVTEDVLQDIVARLVRCADPQRIILFGSRARGDARPDSDVDLLVVEDEPFGAQRNWFEEWSRLGDSLWECPVAVDLLLYSSADVAKWRGSSNHIIYEAVTEGQVVYERP